MNQNQTPTLLDSIRRTIEERHLFTARSRVKYVSALKKASSPTVVTRLTRLKAKVIEEIVSSEEKYLENLSHLAKFRDCFHMFVERKKIQGLLRELDPIKNVNEILYKELKSGSIAKAFVNYGPYLKLYSLYASGFQEQDALIDHLLETNQELREAVLSLESKLKTKLHSLLIVPIQRIPRYKLLLQQLLGFMKSNEEGFNEVLESSKKVEEIATHMNNMVRSIELQKRMLLLNKMLNMNVVFPGRNLLKESYVRKIPNDTERYLILFSDQIMICKLKSEFGTKNCLDCSLILPLKKCSLNRRGNQIEIKCDSETFRFFQEDEWFETIHESIRSLKKKAASLKKPSSKRLPMKKREIANMQETPKTLKRFLNISGRLNEIVDYLSPIKRQRMDNGHSSTDNGNGQVENSLISYTDVQPYRRFPNIPNVSCNIL